MSPIGIQPVGLRTVHKIKISSYQLLWSWKQNENDDEGLGQ